MAKKNNPVTAGYIGGDADPETIEKVYVGIPDVLTPEQVIRHLALSASLTVHRYVEKEEDPSEVVLKTAGKFEAFIKDGASED